MSWLFLSPYDSSRFLLECLETASGGSIFESLRKTLGVAVMIA